MKKLLITIVVLFLLAAGGLFALAKLAPMDRIKQEAVAAVKAQTGRDLAFEDAKLSFWPQIGLTLQNATFSNADWSKEKDMVALKNLDIRLAVMPLLQKRVEVSKVVLIEPVIYLEKSADGKVNWEMTGEKKEEAGTSAKKSANGSNMTLAFNGLEITKGRVIYNDLQQGKNEKVEDLDLKLAFQDMAHPVKIDAKAVYRGKPVTIDMSVDQPSDIVNGKSSPAAIKLDADMVSANINGIVMTSGTYLKNGSIDARISSLSGLLAWLTGQSAEKAPFNKISLSAKANATDKALTLNDAVLSLDDILAKGSVTLGYAGKKPSLKAHLSLDKIDLDRFVGGAGAEGKAESAGGVGEGWDTTPIDLSGLNVIDADVKLSTKGFSLQGIDVGPSVLMANVNDGVLKASSTDAALFGGTFGATVGASAASSAYNFSFDMKNVEAKPVLTTFADFRKLSGKVDANIDVTSSGKTQKAMVEALNGKGAVTFRNGELEGIDLVNIAKLVQQRLGNMGVGEGKTEFVSLGGTFTINKGIVANNDFAMKGPLVQASGKGTVNLPQKSLKYRVIPVLTASSAVDNAKGLKVPVDIYGPFSAIKIVPDFAGMVKNVLENPEEAKAALKNVKEQGKALEDNLKSLKKDLKNDPGKAIGGLLGGGLLSGKPPKKAPSAAPAPASASAPAPAPAPAPAQASVVVPETVPATTPPVTPDAATEASPAAPAVDAAPVAEPAPAAEAPAAETVPAPAPETAP